jgi:hypothetical protein
VYSTDSKIDSDTDPAAEPEIDPTADTASDIPADAKFTVKGATNFSSKERLFHCHYTAATTTTTTTIYTLATQLPSHMSTGNQTTTVSLLQANVDTITNTWGATKTIVREI